MIDKIFDIKKKKILIIGGSSGIGLNLAKDLRKIGAVVFTIGRSSLKKKYHYSCSINDEKTFMEIIKKIKNKYGYFDVLINSAGISQSLNHNNELQNINHFKEIIETNLIGIYKVCKISKGYLKKNSSIINISSIAAKFGFPNNPGYISSKSGLSGLTRSLAYDLAKSKIRVNNIIPGYIKTRMTIKSFKNKKSFNLRKSRTLVNRWGKVNDITGAVIFLASKSSNYVTGTDIVIDGGWSIKGI